MSFPLKVELPPGKVGLGFKGTPAYIRTISDECPVGHKVSVGQRVVQFSVEGECEITGFKIPATLLGNKLKEFSSSSKRVIYVWEDGAPMQVGAPDKLPTGGKDIVPGGTWWKRHRNMSDSVNLGDGKDVDFEYTAVYKEPGPNGRWLNKYGSQTRPGDEEFEYAVPTLASRMACTYKVWLKPGKVGCSFKGVPSVISKINEDSQLFGKVMIGQKVVQCAIDGEIMMEGTSISTNEVNQFLVSEAESEGRTLKLTYQDDPRRASVKSSSAAMIGETYTVVLPAGVAGLSFKGVPCRVSRVSPDGPMAGKGMKIGQQIVGCSIGATAVLTGAGLTSSEVGKFLRDYKASAEDRVLTLTVATDGEFAEKVNTLRSSYVATTPTKYEVTPPPNGMRNGAWLYKEPGVDGRVLNKDGADVKFGFTILVDI